MKIHIFHHNSESHKLDFIIQKLKKMGEQLDLLNQKLDDANVKITKVAADVAYLHSLVDGTEIPTAEQWAAIQGKVDSLNTSLQSVDDATAEPTPEP